MRANPGLGFVGAFLEVAAGQPHAPAIVHGDTVVTYGETAAMVERCAAALRAAGCDGGLVAFSLPKGPQAVVLMLACLLARVPYLPIDAGAPLPRRRQILADADPVLLVVPTRRTADWPGERFATFGSLVRGGDDATARYLTSQLAVARRTARGTAADDLAYVLYTSGSTGSPKGVMISTANAGYFVDWASRAFPLGPGDQVAQHAPLHFDLPVYDVFVALSAGACLHVVDERTAMFPSAVYTLLRERGITAAYMVPSALNALVRRSGFAREGLPDLRQLLYAGEEYPVPQLRTLTAGLRPDAFVGNLYGPVETNVVTWHGVDTTALAAGRVPIGRAVPGTDVRVLDAAGGSYARSAEGELIVSGPSVSPGYLNDPRRTASTRVTTRVDGVDRVYYRTGDFARIDAEGVVHFLGRRDGLVKTRGFRVEVGDVEAVLAAHDQIRQAAVVPVEDSGAGTVMAAHVVAAHGAELTADAVRRWVGKHLPSYMVPALVTFHRELPTTSTGKIARAELGGVR
ncbi:amino acid adenylation domain-containing protein [Streptomyces sp. NPDC021020]|uniref:amino acid adenylation domain-containing protein n=1 Tax=Streptomyces sp. NPDC021020 TaxID=3365109 RepID=UPI00378B9224